MLFYLLFFYVHKKIQNSHTLSNLFVFLVKILHYLLVLNSYVLTPPSHSQEDSSNQFVVQKFNEYPYYSGQRRYSNLTSSTILQCLFFFYENYIMAGLIHQNWIHNFKSPISINQIGDLYYVSGQSKLFSMREKDVKATQCF